MAVGRKTGGRQKGVTNKATRERAILAEQIVTEQRKRGKKLAREVLDEFMHLFAGVAAMHQPLPPGVLAGPGQLPDEPKFLTYAKLAVDTAAELAGYQSPKLKAVMINQDPTMGGEQPSPAAGMVDQLTPQQAYRLLRDADVIDVLPAPKPKKASGG